MRESLPPSLPPSLSLPLSLSFSLILHLSQSVCAPSMHSSPLSLLFRNLLLPVSKLLFQVGLRTYVSLAKFCTLFPMHLLSTCVPQRIVGGLPPEPKEVGTLKSTDHVHCSYFILPVADIVTEVAGLFSVPCFSCICSCFFSWYCG